jgi:hypothetical protein
MSEQITEVLDEARLVRAAVIGGIQHVAVWHGGRTVNVYCVETRFRDTWNEVHAFTVQGPKGFAPERETVSVEIEDTFSHIAEEAGVEVRYGGAFR